MQCANVVLPPPAPLELTPATANRLVCRGQTYETELFIDVASEIYNLKEGDHFTMTLASTLRLDGKPDEDTYNQDGKVCGPPAARGARTAVARWVDSLLRAKAAIVLA
jgi:hypothetical protein